MFSKIYKIEAFIPDKYVDKIADGLNEIGALTIGGDYDYCMFRSKGTGSFRPLNGADPFIGKVGSVSKVEETKIEFCCRREVVRKAVETISRIHPYEVPVVNILPVLSTYDFVEELGEKPDELQNSNR